LNSSAFFCVQGRRFAADTSLAERDSFEVRSLPRPYKVSWSEDKDVFSGIREFMSGNAASLLLADGKVLSLHGASLPRGERVLDFSAAEDSKTMDGAARVLHFLAANGITKGGALIVAGGGIAQDVGGFAAGMYKRGVPLILYPTTLLAMCDSCIGGKVSLNYSGAKNQLGLIYAPREVVINPHFLRTLDRRDLLSGMGEILKTFIIGGEEFLELYARRVKDGMPGRFEDFRALILCSLSVKRAVVEGDEFELDHRRALNYAHTAGHAVEALSGYAVPHGQAVAAGMIIMNEFSCRRGLMKREESSRFRTLALELLDAASLKALRALPAGDLTGPMRKDKKSLSEDVFLVLQKSAGETVFLRERLDDSFRAEMADIVRREFQS